MILILNIHNKFGLYVVTPLMETDLDRYLKVGEVEPAVAKSMVRQLLSALSFCHERRICHRDVTPKNILITHKDNEVHVYLADFGLCKRLYPFEVCIPPERMLAR